MFRDYLQILVFRREAASLVQFFRYGVVSAIAFLADMGLLLVLAWVVNIHYILAASVGFSLGVVVAYIGSIYWVFSKRSSSNVKKELVIFLLVGVAGLILTDVFLFILIEEINQSLLAAKLYATILVFLFNFSVRKLLLFT